MNALAALRQMARITARMVVVDVLNALLLEATVLLLLSVNADGIQVTYVLIRHGIVL
jgi:hypothetical protein